MKLINHIRMQLNFVQLFTVHSNSGCEHNFGRIKPLEVATQHKK